MRISDWSSDVCSSDLSIGAFDALDDSIGQFGTVANCMLTHTRQQLRARYSVWKSKEVMCRWDSGRPARPRVDDQERKSVAQGSRVYVRIDLGGRRIIKKKKKT